MEAQSLPLRLSLKDVEAQVRHVLHQICRGDAGAVARWYSMDSEARARQPRKADIQYVIAREYGFKSWQSLKDHVAPFDVVCRTWTDSTHRHTPTLTSPKLRQIFD
jgi:hypothetical protein